MRTCVWLSRCALLSVLLQAAATGQETTSIFENTRIGFGEGQTREVRTVVTFPTFGPTDEVTLNWDVLGDADPWDRAGSIHAVFHNGAQLQLGKFVTGFNGTTSHSQDISDLAALLSGRRVRIEAFIDTWVSDAWRFNASVTAQPGTSTNPTWAVPVISRDTGFGRGGEAGTTRQDYTIDVPEDMSEVELTYFASGHHDNQTSNSDEFNRRTHRILVNGEQVWRGVPWRTDGPEYRSVNPTSGRWDGNGDGDTSDPYPIDYWSSDFPRSGWVPGDEVTPYKIDVTPYLSEAGTHTVSLIIEDIDVDSFWRVSAYLSGTPATADFDADGDVDGSDFLTWQQNHESLSSSSLTRWEQSYLDGNAALAALPIPEPSAFVLLTGLGLCLICTARQHLSVSACGKVRRSADHQ